MEYNPHRPQVLGNEWVPINQADYTPDAITERGYDFTTTAVTAGAVQGGSFTVAGLPVLDTRHTAQVLAIYPQGTMDQTGPVYELIVAPDSASAVTVGTIVLGGGASDLRDAVQSPADSKYFTYTSGASTLPNAALSANFFFTTSGLLPAGRRILGVWVDYQLEYPELPAGSDPEAPAGALRQYTSLSYYRTANASQRLRVADEPPPTGTDTLLIRSAALGECNFFWDNATVATDRHEIMPWTATQLTWFNNGTTAANRLAILLESGAVQFAAPGQLKVGYIALRIRYCLEKRIKFGGFHKRQSVPYSTVLPGPPGGAGSQYVSMRDTALAKTTLAAGAYTITSCNVYSPDVGVFPLASPGTPPPMSALRQETGMPAAGTDTLRGWLVRRTTDLGALFTQERSQVIVPLSLGHSTGPTVTVTATHGYADQIAAPAYGSVSARQAIFTTNATGLTYRYASFIARRLAGTATLTLSRVEGPVALGSITAAAFDALPEIIDGWKRVTILLTTPQTIAAAATVTISWDAATADEGTQWQILGARNKPMTNTGGTPSPLSWGIEESGYGAGTIQATWKPPTSATAIGDINGDLHIVLSADPAPVTGFTATPALDDVVNYAGLDPCGNSQCCIPTQVGYIALAWTPTTLPADQFGRYELQRKNDAGVYETIMVASNPTVASFNDYEARIGYLSEYRIITYDGAGNPAVTQPLASGTVPAPGFTNSCGNKVGLLSLSTNWGDQSLNVAYKMIWENGPEEDFTFFEAAEQEYSRMYQRDYQVQFHPTERGGFGFTRDLLIHQGLKIGDPPPGRLVLANISALRDIAYADIPYVCVRDESGNRWYMGVRVPAGAVSRIGKTYVAKDVEFTQVTATPAQVPRP